MSPAVQHPQPARRTRFAIGVLLFATACACSPSFQQGPLGPGPKGATYAEVDGVRLRYVDRPADKGAAAGATPVVLIHGFAASLDTWDAVIPALAKDRRVLALDLKGFGWSDRPEGDYSPAAEARLVLAMMSARGIEKADVVGHSWGASVTLALSLLAPQRVHRLSLYDAWVYEAQLPTFFLWAREGGVGEALFSTWYTERADERVAYAFFDKEKYVSEGFVESIEQTLERPGTIAAALAAVRGQRYAEVETKYPTITAKTLILWGREDEVTLLSYGERLARDLPHAKLVVYPRCGHFPMIEAETASTNELATFLREGDAP